MAQVEFKYANMTLKPILMVKYYTECFIIQYKIFFFYLYNLLELIHSVPTQIKTTTRVCVELFSIISLFNHGCHTNKVSNFSGENLKQR